MPVQNVFEYAVLRVVPCVEREEFLNIGVILYCHALKYLHVKTHLDEARLAAFHSSLDVAALKKNVTALEQVCAGEADAGPIAGLDVAARFRWLSASRSTILQASKVHPGLCTNPAATLERLFDQLVR